MTAPRKRKAPETKSVRRPPGLAVRATLAAGNLVAARPSLFGGIIAFGVIFSFVAANALWYQPRHPHPFLNTRDAFRNYQAATGLEADPADMTTYRIERQGSETDAPPASVIAPNGPEAAGFPTETPSSELVLQIQQQLANLGFYDGTVDGQMGTRTMAAIQFYQDKNGLLATGQPSMELLSSLRVTNGQAAIVPQERPSGDVTTNSTAPDPVAAAIQEEAAQPLAEPMTPPKPIPDARTVKAASKPAAPATATQKPAPAKNTASKAPAPAKAADTAKPVTPVKTAAPKPVAAPKPIAAPKPVADARQVAQPAPVAQKPATPKPTTLIGLLKANSQPKPVKSSAIDTAEALPAAQPKAAHAIDTAEALPAAPAKKAKPVETASAQPAKSATPTKTVVPAVKATAGKPSAQVLKIQQGLTKSYPHLAVTGVAGPETRAAIRNFEKNYNMPVTGEPSEALLKKMKSLGVL